MTTTTISLLKKLGISACISTSLMASQALAYNDYLKHSRYKSYELMQAFKKSQQLENYNNNDAGYIPPRAFPHVKKNGNWTSVYPAPIIIYQEPIPSEENEKRKHISPNMPLFFNH